MTEQALKHRVQRELELEPSLDMRGVHVAVEAGVVTLFGSVPSYAEKVAAERAAHAVRAAETVVNELEVQVPLPQRRSDAELAAAVSHALHWDVTVPRDAVRARLSRRPTAASRARRAPPHCARHWPRRRAAPRGGGTSPPAPALRARCGSRRRTSSGRA